ncbi:MAG: preprotein translocase subunit YajC [Betaproteobacteria bacterium]|nr:preprotein translocase subunit YajC [Betaproteobacteria bacterium]
MGQVVQCPVQFFASIPQETDVLISLAHAQQTTTSPAAGQGAGLLDFLPFVLVLIALYFIMVRPQMKRAKEHRTMVEAIAKGDEVVTQGGIAGKVSKVGDNFITLEVAENTEVQVQKQAVQLLLPKGTLKSL